MDNLPAISLVIVVVLAGCAVPVSEQGSTRSQTDNPSSDISATQSKITQHTTTDSLQDKKAPLGIEENSIFEKLTKFLSVNADAPSVRYTESDLSKRIVSNPPFSFGRALGLENESRQRRANAGGLTISPNQIEIKYGESTDPIDLRTVLVHEYIHSIQLQDESYRSVERIEALESARAAQAISEGVAVRITQLYAERYGTVLPDQELVCESYDTGSGATKIELGPYCVGAQYVESLVDDPTTIAELYRNPPNTTEQIRHKLDPDEEPPLALSVTVTESTDWTDVTTQQPPGAKRQGELWTYGFLTAQLSEPRADEAATGWGNDTRMRFSNRTDTGWVWITRWDSPKDATEFETAMELYLQNVTWVERRVAEPAINRINDSIVVVVAGNSQFVHNTNVSVENETVVVAPPTGTSDSVENKTETHPQRQ